MNQSQIDFLMEKHMPLVAKAVCLSEQAVFKWGRMKHIPHWHMDTLTRMTISQFEKKLTAFYCGTQPAKLQKAIVGLKELENGERP